MAKVKSEEAINTTTTAQLPVLAVKLLIDAKRCAEGDPGKAGKAPAAALERSQVLYAEGFAKVTEPVAVLLLGGAEKALDLYHQARVAHQHEMGSISSRALQLKRLLPVLPRDAAAKDGLAREFRLEGNQV